MTKNQNPPKHFPFSVKIPIFASVPRAKRSNAAKPAQLPNRYRLPNFLLFKSYLPTDYKKTIVFYGKNFLFCRNHEAAENTAVICSLLASCKASQVNPRKWLTDIIAWLPYYTRDKGKDLKELLPNYWKLRKSKEI